MSGFFVGAPTGYYLGPTGTDTSVSIAGGVISIDAGGVLRFARPAGFRGDATVTVRAYNAFGESSPLPVTFRLFDPTLVTSLSGSGAQEGTALSGYSIGTTGGQAPYGCTLATGDLPAGVTLNPNCTLSGTPTASGTFTFAVDVTDSSVGPGGANPFTQRSGTLSLVVQAPPVPVVTGISPAAGPEAGGNAVVITGGGFVNVRRVEFGAATAPAFTIDGPSQITATAPAGVGLANVTVVTDWGTSPDSAANDYSYVPAPTLSSLSVTEGRVGAAIGSVTLTGSGFAPARG